MVVYYERDMKLRVFVGRISLFVALLFSHLPVFDSSDYCDYCRRRRWVSDNGN